MSIVASEERRPGTKIPIYDPCSGARIGEVPDGGNAAINDAVARARATFVSGIWRTKLAGERSRILWAVSEEIEKSIEELIELDSLNTGMSPAFARNLILAGTEVMRYYAGWCTKVHGLSSDLRTEGGFSGTSAELHAYTIKEPIGVAALITPWNGPIFCALQKLAPALAAGCSCILKPAEETPLSTVLLGKIISRAGVPEDVVNVVTGYGHTTGAALVAHPDVDKVAFTGSTEVGKLIVQAAAGNLKKVTLELGGKSPVLIFDDADLDKAIAGASLGAFINSGQTCTCGSRIYVQRGAYDRVARGIADFARSLTPSGSSGSGARIGPLISEKQLSRVLGFIADGRSDGACVMAGGNRMERAGFFVEPTVVTDVRPDMNLMREEIFGPVVVVTPFDDEEEVIAEANDSTYGLAASVWSESLRRAHRLAKRLEAGTIWLNCQTAWDVGMPFGGFKQSGWGQEFGWAGVDAYLRTKTVYAAI